MLDEPTLVLPTIVDPAAEPFLAVLKEVQLMSTPQPNSRRGRTIGATAQRRVLLIGKSSAVLADTVRLLDDRGFTAEATNRFDDVLAEFDVRRLDLVVFGGQVPEERRATLKRDILARNERVSFVQGLSGIPGLIARQVAGAFAPRDQNRESPPCYDADERTITLSLRQFRDVTVIAWWPTVSVPPNPLSDSLVLIEKRLAKGAHFIPVPHVVPHETSFVTVQVDDAVWAFRAPAPAHP
jgi:hypothetical protein